MASRSARGTTSTPTRPRTRDLRPTRRRPHAGAHDRVHAGPGPDRGGVRADVRLRPHGRAAGRCCETIGAPPRRPTARPCCACISDLRIGIEGNRARARHTLQRGRAAVSSRSAGPMGIEGPKDGEDAHRRMDATYHYWREWLGGGSLPRPPLARLPAAFGVDAQGPYLRPHWRDGSRRDHLAARDARRRAQLGLPLLLDARRDLHAVGPARAGARLGGRRLHAVRRRSPARRGRRAADHVRHRRRARPDRAGARLS